MLKNYCKKFSKISRYLIFYMFKNSQYIFFNMQNQQVKIFCMAVWTSVGTIKLYIIQVIKTQFLEIKNELFSKLVSNLWILWCQLLYKSALIQSHKYIGCDFHKQNLKNTRHQELMMLFLINLEPSQRFMWSLQKQSKVFTEC
jgi:hypothetical protein